MCRALIHHHGTPLTPRAELYKLAGRHFCVSYADPRDLAVCLQIGQSTMGDSGEFSRHKLGLPPDWQGYDRWLDGWLRPPHWAVVPDRIGGDVEAQREAQRHWRFPRHWGAAVWHLHLPLDWLAELSDEWPFIAFGSSAQFWKVRSDPWRARVDEAWNMLARRHRYLPRVHMLRAMQAAANGPWPFASADSTTVAKDHAARPLRGKPKECPDEKAARMDQRNPPARIASHAAQPALDLGTLVVK